MRMKQILFIVMSCLLIQGGARSDVLTVGHGSNYDFNTITEAMAEADAGDQIQVAAGTYSENHPQYPESFPIYMKPGVILRRLSPEILPVIDANQINHAIRCWYIQPGSNTQIEGFKITGGYNSSFSGGGIDVEHASLTIRACEITGNSSYEIGGGGLSVIGNSNLELIDCLIEGNSADLNGGGIYVENAMLRIEDCVIQGNSTPGHGGGVFCRNSSIELARCAITGNQSSNGGGIYIHYYSEPGGTALMKECTISGNKSALGGGLCINANDEMQLRVEFCQINNNEASSSGGGIFCEGSIPIFAYTAVSDNRTELYGGGFYLKSCNPKLVGCILNRNNSGFGASLYGREVDILIFDCLFSANHAVFEGGGIYAIESTFDVTNSTFEGNYAADGGGAMLLDHSVLSMLNSILYYDSSPEIFSFSSDPVVQFCDVQGGYAGTGNIDVDPLFTSGINGNHYLSQIEAGQTVNSPCIDAGNSDSSYISINFEDISFFLSDSSTRTDRVHDTGLADMGYHYCQDPTECTVTGCEIIMPSADYGPGDECYCDVIVCNTTFDTLEDTPVFVVLEVAGYFLFAPEYDDFAFFRWDVLPGIQYIHVIPSFAWPPGVGSASGVTWYAAMTNPEMTELVGELDIFTFGWHQ